MSGTAVLHVHVKFHTWTWKSGLRLLILLAEIFCSNLRWKFPKGFVIKWWMDEGSRQHGHNPVFLYSTWWLIQGIFFFIIIIDCKSFCKLEKCRGNVLALVQQSDCLPSTISLLYTINKICPHVWDFLHPIIKNQTKWRFREKCSTCL